MRALGKSNTTLEETREEHGHVQEDNETKEMGIAVLLRRRETEDTLAQQKHWQIVS